MNWRDELPTIAVVATGGAIGASARWAVGNPLAPSTPDGFPWHTFTVNVVGCFLIGLASTRIVRPSIAWSFTSTGVLGGFTTMSAFAVELNDLADNGETTTMVAYLLATLVVGFAALAIAEAAGGTVDDASEGSEEIE